MYYNRARYYGVMYRKSEQTTLSPGCNFFVTTRYYGVMYRKSEQTTLSPGCNCFVTDKQNQEIECIPICFQ